MGRIRALFRRVRMIPVSIGYHRGPKAMSRLRKWWLLFCNPHVRIEIDEPVYIGPGFSLYARNGGTLRIGAGCDFRRGMRIELASADSELTIGAGSGFTYYSLIQCGGRIEIGERCYFGQSSMIVDGNHRFRDLTRPMLAQGYDLRPIRIEDDVTTTTKCTIVANIGTRTFVGANSVVSRDLPPYVVAVGAPAKPIEYFGPPGGEPPELGGSAPVREPRAESSEESAVT